ncbi:hypothetical protein PanWU01x14_304190 [Parasponia andersonii]|uniref:Uncharacterized protein n=1 Tax=Parasponia andersonii TaxID=3476 RepID=A0A2P5ASK1_PARAD|nr:hypothetical protein PanWU01x14_304190 [Parasponia andersonii]
MLRQAMNLDLNLVDIGFKDQMPEGVNKYRNDSRNPKKEMYCRA